MHSTLKVTIPESVTLDLAGAWRLREWLKAAEAAGASVEFDGPPPGQLELIDSTLAGKARPAPPARRQNPRSSRSPRSADR